MMGKNCTNENLTSRIVALEVKTAVLDEEHKKDMSANEIALGLQAKEYERRLDGLNHETERIKNIQTTYMPKEVYEQKHALLEVKIENLQRLVYIGLGIILTVEFLLKYITLK
jgi:hypothetical protein